MTIRREEDLLVATPQLFAERFAIGVHCRTEAVAVDRAARVLHLRDLDGGGQWEEAYDALVLATGAAPVRPNLPGIDRQVRELCGE